MPRVVAVVGASRDRSKFGNKAVRAFRHAGYEVVPITTAADAIEDLPAYPSVLDVAGRIDLATVYLEPAAGEAVIDEIARKGIEEVWLNPARTAPGSWRGLAPSASSRFSTAASSVSARAPPAIDARGNTANRPSSRGLTRQFGRAYTRFPNSHSSSRASCGMPRVRLTHGSRTSTSS